MATGAEQKRLEQNARHETYWARWGPYLSERAWGNVREDYSADGEAWKYFPHDHARSRAYRWTEDGIAGICDRHQTLCFALALWNGRDPILKERLFGLNGEEGNHGEDVKEYYYYLDSTPTHSYMKCLYKYPQAEYPYDRLVAESRRRDRSQPEFELVDTGILDQDRYFDIFTEYAKADADDLLIRITAINRGPDPAPLHLLPTLWFRNRWSWGIGNTRPELRLESQGRIRATDTRLGEYSFWFDESPDALFTENDTNTERFDHEPSNSRHYKDAFHERIVHNRTAAVNPEATGTKACAWYRLSLQPGEAKTIRLRLSRAPGPADPAADFEAVFAERLAEADEFYASLAADDVSGDARSVQRQAFAGLLWSKQFYHYVVEQWLDGDPAYPQPPESRKQGRNHKWPHLYNADIISMPDKWEYPWYAAWDLAFHAIPLALVDSDFAKRQLLLFLREWYMHPSGQLPAYEWSLDDVNPPVHAWACWRVYTIERRLRGKGDLAFLESAFHKLLMNFTWWVNREDSEGNNIFGGGFLGLDNIGLFDRSKPLPGGGQIEQSDGTSWVAMYCLNMLKIALELAVADRVYEDIASKFFEHFLYIAHALNQMGNGALWNEQEGFCFDVLKLPGGRFVPVGVRSLVGLIPLFAVEILEPENFEKLPGFRKRMEWFIHNRPDLCGNLAPMTEKGREGRILLSLLHGERLERVLRILLDESEFLSPHGIRSLSRRHWAEPYRLQLDGMHYEVNYEPAESETGMLGGNSNWRGPVWFPANYLIIESLQRYEYYLGDSFQMDFPTGSGQKLNLAGVAAELSRRLVRIFLRQPDGTRPVFGSVAKFQNDPNFRDYLPFHEYFHGETAAGLGASHQTGWTALVAKLISQSGE